MNDRIHACLDGDISADSLCSVDLLRMVQLQEVIDVVAAPIRSAPVPEMRERVMQALPQTRPAPLWHVRLLALGHRVLDWLWQPRPLRLHLHPAYVLAGMVFALVTIPRTVSLPPLPPALSHASGSPPAPADLLVTPAPSLYVQFRLEATGATQVALVGSFTEWQPRHQLTELTPGVWTALVPLAPGVHDYVFLVDGKIWKQDPSALQVADSFGGTNSRLALPAPAGGV